MLGPIGTPNESTRLHVHIGFPKTGTTTLQRSLFDRHSEIVCIGKPYHDRVNRRNALWSLASDDDMHFCGYEDQIKGIIDHAHQTEANDGRRIILSEERFTGQRAIGRGIVAQRLRQHFPRAGILVVVRSQPSMLSSGYAAQGRTLSWVPQPFLGRHVSLQAWLDYIEEQGRFGILGMLDYWRTIDFYCSLFGRDRVTVLLFEELVEDVEQFARKISGVLGINADESIDLLRGEHHNPRYRQRQVRYQALREKFFPGRSLTRWIPGSAHVRELFGRSLTQGRGLSIDLPEAWIEKLRDRYSEGNGRLQEEFHLPLERYGYPVPN